MPKRITKQQIETFTQEYKVTGNIRASCKSAGIDYSSARNLLNKTHIQPFSALSEVPTEAIVKDLAKKIEAMPNVKELNFKALAKKLESNNIIAVLKDPKKFDDTTRELARIAFMRVLVEILDDRKLDDASLNSLASVIPVLADAAAGKYQFIDPKNMGNIKTEDIIIKIQAGIRRIRQFNPTLSNEVKEQLEAMGEFNPKEAGKVLDAEYKEEKSHDTGKAGN